MRWQRNGARCDHVAAEVVPRASVPASRADTCELLEAVKARKNKQAATHPWRVAGEVVKRQRLRKIAQAIAKMRPRNEH